MKDSQRQMIASFSYDTLRKRNASPTTDFGDESTTVAEPLYKEKKNTILIYLVECFKVISYLSLIFKKMLAIYLASGPKK